MGSSRKWELLGIVLIVSGAAILRFWNLNWDHGLLLHPDEYNLIAGAARLTSYGSNPLFFAYNGLGLYPPRIVAEIWAMLAPASIDPRSLSVLSYTSRVISATLSSATVVIAWRIGRIALGPATGLLAASLFALNVASIQAAHFGTTESALNFIELLVTLMAALYLGGLIGFDKMVLSSACFIGAGLAIKTSAAVLAIIPFVSSAPQFASLGLLRIARAGFYSSAVCLFFFALLSPHSVLFLRSFLDVMQFEKDVVTGDLDVYWTWQFIDQPNYIFPLAQFAWLCGPLTAGIGLAGVLIILFEGGFARRPAARCIFPLAVFVIVQFAIVGGWHAKFVRYLMPCVPGVLMGAAFVLGRARQEQRQFAFIAGTALVLVSSGFWAAAYMSIYRHEDSRIAASEWLLRETADNQLILREPWDNPLPLPVDSRVRVHTRNLRLFEEDPQRGADALSEDLALGDWLVIASRRHSGTLPRLRTRFPLACFYYQALFRGELGYRLVQTFANEPMLLGLTIPTRYAEETFQVFDHPTVRIFRNLRRKSAAEIRASLMSDFTSGHCASQ